MKASLKQVLPLLIFVAFLPLVLAGCATSLAAAQTSDLPKFTLISTTSGDLEPPTASEQQSSSQVFDVDKDGVNDIVIGSRLPPGPYMVWYRRGSSGWQRYLIDDQDISMSPSGTFVDIDGDGDTDVVMGGSTDSPMIWWWENPYPDYEPNTAWPRHTIKTSGEPKHHDMLAADFDNDGKPELAFWNQYARVLNLAKIPDDPKSLDTWPLTPIFTWEGEILKEGLEAADIDGDGWLDLVGAGRWFKNEGGTKFTENVIDLDFSYGRVAVGQIVAGGWPEVVMGIGDDKGNLKWFQWNGSKWEAHDLGAVDHGHSLQLVDINLDGNLDIFVAEMRLDGENEDSGMWFLIGDGQGQFRRGLVAEGYDNHENRVADLDGDGDLDILGKPFNYQTPALNIWLNQGMPVSLDKWNRHVVDDARPWRSLFITGEDVDGDKLNDILTGGWWYKNPGAAQGGWQRQPIGGGLNNLAAVYDFDRDGDVDVLGTGGEGSDPNNTFVWASNDGKGSFTIHDNVQPGAGTFLQGVAVDTFDGDATGVALSWHNDDSDVQIIDVPADPLTAPWTVRTLSTLNQSEGIDSGDMDGDGQVDLMLGKIWLSNASGKWQDHPLVETADEPDRNLLADINGDGRLDGVIGYEAKSKAGKLAWYEQPGQPGGKWTEHLIADPPVIAPMSVDAADMDDDGDLDIIAGEHNLEKPEKAGLFVFENLDGAGLEWQRHPVFVGDEHHMGAQVVDIDGDGDLDILSIGWNHATVLLYENLAKGSAGEKPAGDATAVAP
jgi:hypothetical protein